MFKAACLLALVCTGGVALIHNRPERNTSAPAPAHSSVIRIDEASETVGAYIYVGEAKVQIVDLLWGIDFSDNVCLALFKGVGEDGTVYEYCKPEIYKRVAYFTSELRGAFLKVGENGDRVRIEELTYTLTTDGLLTPLSLSGATLGGVAFTYAMDLGGIVCCQPVTVTACTQGTCSGNGCAGPTNCACTGSGSCAWEVGAVCKGKCHVDNCPGAADTRCAQQGTGTPVTCVCD